MNYSDKVQEQIIVHSDRRKTYMGICESVVIPQDLIIIIMKEDFSEQIINKHKITNELVTNQCKL